MGEALKRGVDQSLLYLEVLGEMQDIVGALFGIASRWKILSLVGLPRQYLTNGN
jgi:hypothetical protein